MAKLILRWILDWFKKHWLEIIVALCLLPILQAVSGLKREVGDIHREISQLQDSLTAVKSKPVEKDVGVQREVDQLKERIESLEDHLTTIWLRRR